jgi:hypothetical protein
MFSVEHAGILRPEMDKNVKHGPETMKRAVMAVLLLVTDGACFTSATKRQVMDVKRGGNHRQEAYPGGPRAV